MKELIPTQLQDLGFWSAAFKFVHRSKISSVNSCTGKLQHTLHKKTKLR